MADLFARHRATLEKALEASRTRGYWSPHPEIPSGKIYGENAKAEADAAFAALRGALFLSARKAVASLAARRSRPGPERPSASAIRARTSRRS